VRLRIELERVKPYVWLRHIPFATAGECAAAIAEICGSHSFGGHPVHFVDGTVFDADRCYVTLGTFVDDAPYLSDYTGQHVFYQSVGDRAEDYLSVRDYLWRWDTDWFWCSKVFGVQNPAIRRFWPQRYLRSDFYRRMVAFDRRHRLSDKVYRLRHQPAREAVIQDVEIPVGRLAEFLDFFHAEIGISPVWLCPLRLRGERTWPLYPLAPDELYVNVGFWATVPLRPGDPDGTYNRLIEAKVTELNGHKSLYSTSFYSPDEFWRLYNGAAYRKMKQEYDPDDRLPDLYAKCVGNR
jgi:FAD/FMN-containing dehydrogenase